MSALALRQLAAQASPHRSSSVIQERLLGCQQALQAGRLSSEGALHFIDQMRDFVDQQWLQFSAYPEDADNLDYEEGLSWLLLGLETWQAVLEHLQEQPSQRLAGALAASLRRSSAWEAYLEKGLEHLERAGSL